MLPPPEGRWTVDEWAPITLWVLYLLVCVAIGVATPPGAHLNFGSASFELRRYVCAATVPLGAYWWMVVVANGLKARGPLAPWRHRFSKDGHGTVLSRLCEAVSLTMFELALEGKLRNGVVDSVPLHLALNLVIALLGNTLAVALREAVDMDLEKQSEDALVKRDASLWLHKYLLWALFFAKVVIFIMWIPAEPVKMPWGWTVLLSVLVSWNILFTNIPYAMQMFAQLARRESELDVLTLAVIIAAVTCACVVVATGGLVTLSN